MASLLALAAAAVILFFCMEFYSVSAQGKGFLSLDCGLEPGNNYTDQNGIDWVSDASYLVPLHLSQTSFVNTTAISPPLVVNQVAFTTMRYFPGGVVNQSKYCYQMGGLTKGEYYLIRASFFNPNYTAPNFALVVDTTVWPVVIDRPDLPYFKEVYAPTLSSRISICLAKTDPNSDPFISSLELRVLNSFLVATKFLKANNNTAHVYYHINYGESSAIAPIRYPDDPFDRIWYPRMGDGDTPRMTTDQTINRVDSLDLPPSSVLQTAFGGGEDSSIQDILNITSESQLLFITFFFAEIGNVTHSAQRVFNIYVNDITPLFLVDIINLVYLWPFRGLTIFTPRAVRASGSLNFTYTQEPSSQFPPIVSAIEVLRLSDNPLSLGTASDDVSAIEDLQKSLGLTNWSGDPCLPFQFNWLNCSSKSPPRINALILSNRNLSGSLPASLNMLTEVQTILLDRNELTGSIPDLRDLSNLQTLDLSNNLLNGSIPDYLASLSSLSSLSLQNNNFSGQIPQNLLDKKESAMLSLEYEGNQYLCEPGSSTCATETLADESKNNALPGHIIGVIVAVVCIFVFSTIFLLVRKCKKNAEMSEGTFDEHGAKLFTYHEIEIATNNFCNILGKGGYGSVYMGTLRNSSDVAVKILAENSQQGYDAFVNEVVLLSRIHHRNLLALLGYCTEIKLALVYEFIPGGTLSERLYGNRCSNPLSWKQRLVIALGSAQGLDYLHRMCHPAIIHRDVKSDNILLNEGSKAKVADFGISRSMPTDTATHILTKIVGTPGYIDPEFFNTGELTTQSDVFSFGVVLLEIICAKPPNISITPERTMHISQWVRPSVEAGDMEDVIDPMLKQQGNYNPKSVWKVAEMGVISTHESGEMRPTMSEIVKELQYALQLQLDAYDSLSD